MPLSIKVNLRVTGHCNQGGRKYMEDMFSVAYQQTSDDKDLEYAFFGIFDGHGGGEAATFAKEHLMDIIVKQKNFWSNKDEDVLRAIRDGYVNTHYAMWRELDKWPRTASGLPSTAGTTASIAFIRKGKMYIGHVGDSGIILGYQDDDDPHWKAKPLTKDHKPESVPERTRIHESGGKVVSKSGVPRVVWNRPRIGHKGPVRRSTHIDEIPFLAVARSLGDLWSYNSELDTFVVSPEPDVRVVTVNVKSHRCLIFGTDGLWNMLTPQKAVSIVQEAEKHNEMHFVASQQTGNAADAQMWMNPSKSLVDHALKCWSSTRLRADNTSVVTLMLDPPGPSRGEVLLSRKNEKMSLSKSQTPQSHTCASVSPLLQDSSASRISGLPPELSQDFNAVSQTSDEVPDVCEKIASDSRNVQPVMYPCPLRIVQAITKDISSIVSEVLRDVDASAKPLENLESTCESFNSSETFAPELETLDSSPIHNGVYRNRMLSPESRKLSSESAISSRNIQVAEVSSSDTAFFKNDEGLVYPVNDYAIGDCETPDSPSKNLETLAMQNLILKPLNSPNNLQKLVLSSSKVDSFKIARKNAFSASREEMKKGPMLRKRTHFGIQSLNDVSTKSQTKRRPHSAISDKRGPMLIARCELRSTNRRKNAVNVAQMRSATSSLVFTERKEAEGADCLRKSSQTMNFNSEGSAKRRHSSTFENAEVNAFGTQHCSKRRTRSEDRPCPKDENDPDNQGKQLMKLQSRVRWPGCAIASKTRNSNPGTSYGTGGTKDSHVDKVPSPGYQRRSIEKKATPVKSIRRPSINGVNRLQLRGSFALRDSLSPWDQSKGSRRSDYGERTSGSLRRCTEESFNTPQMWLRSDTIAATPIKTLRSRNIDIAGHTVPPQVAHQYGIVKQKRSFVSKLTSGGKGKMKAGTSLGGGGTSGNGSGSVGGIAKKVKSVSPYNPSARSFNTRSRLKRLGK